jgi:hypothetical protein
LADLGLVRRLVSADHGLAVAATARPDGSVHASLVNAGLVIDPSRDEPVVGFVVSGSAHKLRLLRASGSATVVWRAGWEWVAVEGPVRLIGPDDPPGAADPGDVPALLRAVFVAAGGTHDDWAAFDRVMADERRVAVLVDAERITSNS